MRANRVAIFGLLLCVCGCQHRRPKVPDNLPTPANVYYADHCRRVRLDIDGRQFNAKVDLEHDATAPDYYGIRVLVVDDRGTIKTPVIETTDGRQGIFGGYDEETWDTAWSIITDGSMDAPVPLGSEIRTYLFLIHHSPRGEQNEFRVFEMAAATLPAETDGAIKITKFDDLPRLADRADRETIVASRRAAENYAAQLRKLLD
jgi:hypothetical protein